MVNIGIGTAALASFLGYAVVFLGILILMVVISIMGTVMKKNKAAASPAHEVVDLGSMTAPAGVDPMKVAALAAVIAEMEREV